MQWRKLLDDARHRRFDLLLVWRANWAFRLVIEGATTLERLRAWGIGFRRFMEPWLNTTTPFGEALFHNNLLGRSLRGE